MGTHISVPANCTAGISKYLNNDTYTVNINLITKKYPL